MKSIEKGSIKYLVLLIISVSLFSLVLYPLLDLLVCKFITNSTFEYSVIDHIVEPIIFSIIFSLTVFVLDRKKK